MSAATRTFAKLEVSTATYDEIAGKLRAAGYDHAFIDGAIDMHGIGLTRGRRTNIDPTKNAEKQRQADMRLQRRRFHDQVRDQHPCPRCGAPRAEDCTDRRDRPMTRPHAARINGGPIPKPTTISRPSA